MVMLSLSAFKWYSMQRWWFVSRCASSMVLCGSCDASPKRRSIKASLGQSGKEGERAIARSHLFHNRNDAFSASFFLVWLHSHYRMDTLLIGLYNSSSFKAVGIHFAMIRFDGRKREKEGSSFSILYVFPFRGPSLPSRYIGLIG